MSLPKGSPHCTGLWNYARDFFLSANTLRGSEKRLRNAPTYYLDGHAIELTFKSYLCYHGYSDNKLRKIGHNLKELWKNSVAKGLDEELQNTTEIQQCIELINPYYHGKEFEYIYAGFKQYPLISRMHDVGEELIRTVGERIEIPPPQLYRFTKCLNE